MNSLSLNLKKSLIAILSILLSIPLSYSQNTSNSPRIDRKLDVLNSRNLRDPIQRKVAVSEIQIIEADRRTKARQRARQLRKPIRIVQSDGRIEEVSHVDINGQLVYLTTHNVNAAISTGANRLAATGPGTLGLGLTGVNTLLGVWDGGSVRSTHQEFNSGGVSRVLVRDGSTSIDHATHVGGTIAAQGTAALAKGMATQGTIHSFDWNNDVSEMAANAASTVEQTDKLLISNHSYGYIRGWTLSGGRYVWNSGFGSDNNTIEHFFGYYGDPAAELDSLAFDAPYYLMFWSAGNERNNNPVTGLNVVINGTTVLYNPAIHPPGDGVYKQGFDTIGDMAVAKNIMTVGAVTDAVLNGQRDPTRANATSFTSWGPTDDGRIKPDIVANGDSLYSSLNTSNTAYGTSSGTSMSSPNAAGTAGLLVEHYRNLTGGGKMRASTLKGLLIHTADDRGNAGPDYKFGWGLIDGVEAAELLTDNTAVPSKNRLKESTLNSTTKTTETYTIRWDGVSPIRATLSWTDPVGTPTGWSEDETPLLVNNLNLKIISPTGTEYLPYVMPFVSQRTQESLNAPATTGTNNTDNVEQVYIASPPQAGIYQIVISYSGTLTGGSQNYSLLVSGSTDPNAAPTISSIANQSVNKNSSLVLLGFTISDDQTPANELIVTAQSSNSNVVPQEGITINGTEANRSLNIVPTVNAVGETTITVSVNDGEKTSSTQFVVTVINVNTPPNLSYLIDQTVGRNETLGGIWILTEDLDTPQENLSVWGQSSNQNIVTDNNITFLPIPNVPDQRDLNIVPVQDAIGATTITLYLSDGETTVSTSFNLDVINNSPTFDVWPALQGLPPEEVGLDKDPDGDGIPNIMEYYMGLNPTDGNPDEKAAVYADFGWDYALYYYKRGLDTKGVSGEVKWSHNAYAPETWTSEGIIDRLITREANYEIRRAEVPWDPTKDSIYFRLDITVED